MFQVGMIVSLNLFSVIHTGSKVYILLNTYVFKFDKAKVY